MKIAVQMEGEVESQESKQKHYADVKQQSRRNLVSANAIGTKADARGEVTGRLVWAEANKDIIFTFIE